jgi:hypothetical protein
MAPSIFLEVEISLDFIRGQRSIVSFRFLQATQRCDAASMPRGECKRACASLEPPAIWGGEFPVNPPISGAARLVYPEFRRGSPPQDVQLPKRFVTRCDVSVWQRGCGSRANTEGMESFPRVWNFFCDQAKLSCARRKISGGRPSKAFASLKTYVAYARRRQTVLARRRLGPDHAGDPSSA